MIEKTLVRSFDRVVEGRRDPAAGWRRRIDPHAAARPRLLPGATDRPRARRCPSFDGLPAAALAALGAADREQARPQAGGGAPGTVARGRDARAVWHARARPSVRSWLATRASSTWVAAGMASARPRSITSARPLAELHAQDAGRAALLAGDREVTSRATRRGRTASRGRGGAATRSCPHGAQRVPRARAVSRLQADPVAWPSGQTRRPRRPAPSIRSSTRSHSYATGCTSASSSRDGSRSTRPSTSASSASWTGRWRRVSQPTRGDIGGARRRRREPSSS